MKKLFFAMLLLTIASPAFSGLINFNSALGKTCEKKAMSAMFNKHNYSEGVKYLLEGADKYNNGNCQLILGCFYMAGFYVDKNISKGKAYMKKAYKNSVENEEPDQYQHMIYRSLILIDEGKFYLRASDLRTYISNYYYDEDTDQLYPKNSNSGMPINGFGGFINGGGMFGGNSNTGVSNSAGKTCNPCGGSGRCTMCGGDGYYWLDTGVFVGADIKKKQTCSSCHGTGRCTLCHGQGHY